MQVIHQNHSWTEIGGSHILLEKGIGWGFIGGFAATIVMDLILISLLVAAGMPPFTCFSIVGDTVARLFSLESIAMAGSVPLGVAAHYAIGPLMGGIFGAAVAKVHALRMDTPKKGIIFAVLYAEILSQPMLAMTPLLLEMTPAHTLQWYGGSSGMHLIWGCVLGYMVHWGLRSTIATHLK